jgi:pyruvate dehydrogenase E1 component
VRAELRKFFEVNRYYIVVSALAALADDGNIPRVRITEAIDKYGIDPEKPNPINV